MPHFSNFNLTLSQVFHIKLNLKIHYKLSKHETIICSFYSNICFNLRCLIDGVFNLEASSFQKLLSISISIIFYIPNRVTRTFSSIKNEMCHHEVVIGKDWLLLPVFSYYFFYYLGSLLLYLIHDSQI